MIARLRKVIAALLAGFLWLFTLGRIELNRTGEPTATDSGSVGRGAAIRSVDDLAAIAEADLDDNER